LLIKKESKRLLKMEPLLEGDFCIDKVGMNVGRIEKEKIRKNWE
jgi:hypothetical protein